MAFRNLFVLLFVAVLSAAAQTPLSSPVPFAPAASALSPGAVAETLSAAQRAQELGLGSIAAQQYRELLGAPDVDQENVTLALATVLLDEGRALETEQVLRQYSGPHKQVAAWHLRAALAAAQQKKKEATRAEFDAIRPADLGRDDRPWFSFLQGMLTVLENPSDPNTQGKANRFYQEALDTAPSRFVRTRFALAVELTRMRLGTVPSEADLEIQRQNIEKMRGSSYGYEFARQLAVGYDMAGRKGRAVELLQDQLRRMPPNETARLDDFRYLLGVIGGATDGAGRYALVQLLQRGSDLDKQRIALQLLARASTTPASREQFRTELDRLIMAPTPPQFLEDAYLFRALVSLSLKNYGRAEDDARALLEKFPGSPLLAHAYGVLMASAWEQLRFRVAADNAAKAREALPAGAARAELGVVIAEARFRAGQAARSGGASGVEDFRLAAQAYAEALNDPPPGRPLADLIYQRVLAEIESGALETAERLIDEMAKEVPDPIKRWQAEWNLAWALQSGSKSADALARVSRLLAAKGPDTLGLSPELRGRMAWLQAKLSFDVEPSEQTLKFIDGIEKLSEGMREEMRTDIASSAALLKAETFFALRRDTEGLATLAQLRKDFPDSDAAVLSYMKEADRYAQQDKAVDAQKLLVKLAHDYPKSSYAPLALYKAAVQAERQASRAGYEEAVRRIDEMITLLESSVPKDPANNLLFMAHMKQGDVFRSLGQFPQAQTVYQYLCDNFPKRQDVILAQLALAATHHAQAASGPSHADQARVLFEHLNLGLDVSPDVRIEAGFNLGQLFVERGEKDKALQVWWRDVVHAFLDDPATMASLGTGRRWMSRTLMGIGDLLEQDKKLDEAKKAWALVVQAKLPYEAQAREKLAQYNVAVDGPKRDQ